MACVLLDKLLSLGVENARRMNNLIYTNHQVASDSAADVWCSFEKKLCENIVYRLAFVEKGEQETQLF